MDSVELAACPNDANLSLRTSSGCMKEIIYQNTKNGFEGDMACHLVEMSGDGGEQLAE
jgi:hypothetical protein